MTINERLYTLLIEAVINGQREKIDLLLDAGAPVNFPPRCEYRSPLHSSIYVGDLEVVQKLLNRGASVNASNHHSETALTLAAKFEKHIIVDLLLSSEGLMNYKNLDNLTHLHIACMRNKVDVIKKLIQDRADLSTTVRKESLYWPGYTSLHFAVRFKCIETVEYLLSLGADITIKDARQLTPLHVADLLRSEQIIDLILSAHINVMSNPKNLEYLSHFHIACTRNNVEVVEFFIKIGVDLNEYVCGEHYNCDTALDLAMYYGCVDVVKLLLLNGARVRSPVRFEVNRIEDAYNSGHPELIDLLLTKDRLLRENDRIIERIPELHKSCIHNGINTIHEYFFQMPHFLNSTIWNGCTALHLAVERGDYEIIEFLVKEGADCCIKNADGKSPLHLAFEQEKMFAVRLILTNSDEIKQNTNDNYGLSHMHIACTIDIPQVIQRFIKLGFDPNSAVSINSSFWPVFTPLHFAAKFRCKEVIRILLSSGACYSAVDRHDLSAFDVSNRSIQYFSVTKDESHDIMESILSYHYNHRDNRFNDRGYSLLHLLSIDKATDLTKMTEFIDKYPQDLNKAVTLKNHIYNGFTPLHFAIIFGNRKHAELLIKKGANILARAANQDMPLHLAFESHEFFKFPFYFQDSDILKLNPVGSTGYSLFHIACGMGNIKMMQLFLQNGIEVNLSTILQSEVFYDKKPLHLVTHHDAQSGVKAIKLLLENGADVNARDSKMNTALHFMRMNATFAIIDVLVEHGADVNAINSLSETPLLSICIDGDGLNAKKVCGNVKSFLNNGADINLADEEGQTPMTIRTWKATDGWDEEIPNKFLDTANILLKHVIKLETMGFYVSQVNKNAYAQLLEHFFDDLELDEVGYAEECSKELESIKNINVDCYTTLYDILYRDLNKLAVISENQAFIQIVSANDFLVKYPIYGHMLKSQLIKGRVRRPLLQDAQRSLEYLARVSLPGVCAEEMFSYLANDDLRNLIASQKCAKDVE
ncbi:hypothetical protein QAD02_009697 [Eretmocerus hayati]|uniref:Uncharacterized protein n=1 Tax=Eretmocerus hayati TaxID=131215 RepID=A0ACC2NA25_9HYME|nr:hypothetical protein QAD02_009697 [Eretmocerus hayati]